MQEAVKHSPHSSNAIDDKHPFSKISRNVSCAFQTNEEFMRNVNLKSPDMPWYKPKLHTSCQVSFESTALQFCDPKINARLQFQLSHTPHRCMFATSHCSSSHVFVCYSDPLVCIQNRALLILMCFLAMATLNKQKKLNEHEKFLLYINKETVLNKLGTGFK